MVKKSWDRGPSCDWCDLSSFSAAEEGWAARIKLRVRGVQVAGTHFPCPSRSLCPHSRNTCGPSVSSFVSWARREFNLEDF